MELRANNISKIKKKYGKTSEFIKSLEHYLLYLHGKDRIILIKIIIYYNNLFEIPTSMEREILNNYFVSCHDFKKLLEINDVLKSDTLDFLIKLIEYNIKYTNKIKQLA